MTPFIPKRVLLITNIECGELDLFVATAHSLLQADRALDLHFATFEGLQEDVLPEGVSYHEIQGLSMSQALEEYQIRSEGDGTVSESFTGLPGFAKTRRAIRSFASSIMPYTGRQMVDVFTSTVDIIRDLNPDLVVVDSLMSAGLTACYHLGIRFICLGPHSIKEFAALEQPRKAGLWKFPALFSGFEYPVPWSKVLLNIHFILYARKAIKKDPQWKEVQSYLTAHTILRSPVDLLKNRPEGVKILVSSLPQLDYPLKKIPLHVIPCGPIMRRCQPLEETDLKLATWLAEGRTIYVNMGSVVKVSEEHAVELAKALKTVIDTVDKQTEKGRIQVLWKLKKKGKYSVYEPTCSISRILRQEIAHDRVRIVDWIKSEPISILRTGNVVCSVHHGGANSFNEAIVSGVPQVVLPASGVCYDYAQRVELLGVGRCGNHTSKPHWAAEELSRELLNVLIGEKAVTIKEKVDDVKKVCKHYGSGADCAAQAILHECEDVSLLELD